MRAPWYIGAGILGATLMVMLDQRQRSRRHGRVRNQTGSSRGTTRVTPDPTASDRGRSGVESFERSEIGGTYADRRLCENVRGRVRRVVSYPNLVDVQADSGHVTLTGTVPASELERLMQCVRSVRGVHDVENQLVVTSGFEATPRFLARPGAIWPASTSWRLIGCVVGVGAVAYGAAELVRMQSRRDDVPGSTESAVPTADELRQAT